MLLDLLNPNNEICFNIKVAQIIGLHAAIYVSELIAINGKAIEKSKIDNAGYFTVDRKYISERTTLTLEEQEEIDSKLIKIDVLQLLGDDSKDTLKLDLIKLADIIASDDMKELQEIKKKTKIKTLNSARAKMTLRQKQCEDFKNKVHHSCPEIEEALKEWVEGVYANPKGFLSYKALNVFKDTVDLYANGNLDLALKVIEIAAINGYRDATWAINLFEKDYKDLFWKKYKKANSTPVTSKVAVEIGNEVF